MDTSERKRLSKRDFTMGDVDEVFFPPDEDIFKFLDFDDVSRLFRSWQTILGISAFLDFAAAMLKWTNQLTEGGILFWMKNNAAILGMLFSLLWFVNAFVEASRTYMVAQKEADRRALLTASSTPWFQRPITGFCRTIIKQVLLLPVGFFLSVYAYYLFAITDDQYTVQDVRIEVSHHTEKSDMPDQEEIYTTATTTSLAFAIIQHIFLEVSFRTGKNLRKYGVDQVRWGGLNLLKRAARHPFQFTRRVRKALRIIRWVKYLMPLVGTTNKLLGNVVDLLVKWKQRRDAAKAKSIRTKLWDDFDDDELREHCAIIIQKSYRAHKARKLLLALQLLQGKAERIAAIRIQRQLRRVLAGARARIAAKRQELLDLKKQHMNPGMKMADEDRRKMYELEQELKNQTKRWLNEKLLLRPNTNFAVTWKILFVIAVVFEIVGLVLSKKAEALESIFDELLVPEPLSSSPACKAPRLAAWKEILIHRILRRPRRSFEAAWYCDEPYSVFFEVYRISSDLLIHHFFALVGIICFLDVFVTFFMGRFDSETGMLVPSPTFQRWVAPGLMLQLILNPAMDSTANILLKAVSGALRRGPVRVLRWIVALFYPLSRFFVRSMKKRWLKMKVRH